MKRSLIFIFALIFASGFCLANKPDLIIKALSFKPPNMAQKKATSFHAIIQNIGHVTSAPCQLSFRVGGETKAKTYDVQSLKPGYSTTRWRLVQLPYKGKYRVTAKIDSAGQVTELKENNNTKSITYIPGKPDFVVEKITFSNNRPRVGELVTIKAYVKNIGSGFVTPYTVSLRVGGETKPMNISIHTPGINYTVPVQRKFRSTKKGTFLIMATVDPKNVWQEVKEKNNKKTAKLKFR